MLLITMREWFGQSKEALARDGIKSHEVRDRGFVTALPLGKALERINAYQVAFNQRYASANAIEFELISVVRIPRLTAHQIDISRVVHVEKLERDADALRQKWS